MGKIQKFLSFILILIVFGALGLNIYSFKKHTQDLKSLGEKNNQISKEINNLQLTLNNFKLNIENLNKIIKEYREEINKLDAKITENKGNLDLIAKNIKNFQSNLELLQNDYVATFTELRDKINLLKEKFEYNFSKNQENLENSIGLGKVEIEKDTNLTTATTTEEKK